MKYIILLGDGMADYPVPELGGKTPLEYARTPNMDRVAAEGVLGLIDTIPPGIKPGSDVANLTVLGYDAAAFQCGRGPLEAANMGITLGPQDVAFRCNLVTLGTGDDPVMEDFTAGHVSSTEAAVLIRDLHQALGNEAFQFYPGVGYRHLLLWRNGQAAMQTTPPHDITGQFSSAYLPQGEGAQDVIALMEAAKCVLRQHPIHQDRIGRGKKPANAIWLWGQGRAPQLIKITEKYEITGGMISAVDLLNGIGIYAGLEVVRVEGATGYIDTNYVGKAKSALDVLRKKDFVFVHVEAPDEMGHEGNLSGKIKAIEDFDEKVVGTIMQGLETLGPVRLMVLSDHPTPLSLKTHTADPSPFAVWSSLPEENLRGHAAYGEVNARNSGIFISPGTGLIDLFIAHWREFIEQHHQS